MEDNTHIDFILSYYIMDNYRNILISEVKAKQNQYNVYTVPVAE